MDAVKKLRRRNSTQLEPTTPEIRKCQYCKGQFEVNPQFPHKQFCKESHRKLFWKYGSQSVGKLAERIERDMRKLIATEQRAVLCEMVRLRARLDALEHAAEVEREITNNAGGAAA